MAAHFTIPASPGRKVQKVDQFLGEIGRASCRERV